MMPLVKSWLRADHALLDRHWTMGRTLSTGELIDLLLAKYADDMISKHTSLLPRKSYCASAE